MFWGPSAANCAMINESEVLFVDFTCYLRAVRRRPAQSSGMERPYYADIPAIRALSADALDLSCAPVTFLVGENGSGKSTLLEAIAIAAGFNAEGGSKQQRFSTVETHAALYKELQLTRGPFRERDGYFLRAESFYNVASDLAARNDDGCAFLSYGGRPLHAQSHGESFLSLIQNRLSGNGLYLFDEPEAALSPNRQMALLARIHALVQARSQLLIATHSPILLSYPHAVIYLLDDAGVHRTRYRDTEHYAVTRAFLNSPERMLSILLGEDGGD